MTWLLDRARARDPRTVLELQEAIDGAEAALLLEGARQYGLVTGGPGVDVERCDMLRRRAAALYGMRPTKAGVEREIVLLVKGN